MNTLSVKQPFLHKARLSALCLMVGAATSALGQQRVNSTLVEADETGRGIQRVLVPVFDRRKTTDEKYLIDYCPPETVSEVKLVAGIANSASPTIDIWLVANASVNATFNARFGDLKQYHGDYEFSEADLLARESNHVYFVKKRSSAEDGYPGEFKVSMTLIYDPSGQSSPYNYRYSFELPRPDQNGTAQSLETLGVQSGDTGARFRLFFTPHRNASLDFVNAAPYCSNNEPANDQVCRYQLKLTRNDYLEGEKTDTDYRFILELAASTGQGESTPIELLLLTTHANDSALPSVNGENHPPFLNLFLSSAAIQGEPDELMLSLNFTLPEGAEPEIRVIKQRVDGACSLGHSPTMTLPVNSTTDPAEAWPGSETSRRNLYIGIGIGVGVVVAVGATAALTVGIPTIWHMNKQRRRAVEATVVSAGAKVVESGIEMTTHAPAEPPAQQGWQDYLTSFLWQSKQ